MQRQGRLAEAELLFLRVTEADAGNFPAHRMIAVLRYQQRKLGEALSAIDAAINVSPRTAEPWVLRGVILHGLGRPQEAITSVDTATDLDPRDIGVWYNRGVLLGEIGRFEESIDSYDRALALGPHVDALTNRAASLLSLKRAQEALDSCDKALALQPTNLSALCNRALALAELARHEEALAIFDQALALAPMVAQTWSNRGTVLHDLERVGDAVASFDRAIALDPHIPASWANRGRSLFEIRRFDEARESFEKSLAGAAPRTSVDWDSRGDALMGLKRYDEALAAYDTSLAMTRNSARIWSKRAAALYMLARFDEGLEAADHALCLWPDLPVALEMRGNILLEMGRFEEGLASYRRRGVKRNPYAKVLEHKERHDTEQREYLAAQGVSVETGKLYVAGGERISGPAVNPANAEIVAKSWAETDQQIVVIDDLLTPDGWEALRRFCLGSTMWERAYDNGYLGALPESGFAAPLLAQIAEELSATFPTVIGDRGLRLLWGFKYDSTLKGITIHADQAAVNVNFWITPDEANLNPDRGGLVVYDAKAPADWEFGDYNGNDLRIRDFLKRENAKAITVPYRANRAVIFDSDLFHETDLLEFKEGYLNRRINVTMLFGRRTVYGN